MLLTTFYHRFIIARLLLDSIPTASSPNSIRAHLSRLPSGLPATYQMTMERIKAQEPALAELGLRVLTWVYFARKTLTVAQLRHAVSFRPGMKKITNDDLVDEDQIISACAGLISVIERTKADSGRPLDIPMREYHFSRTSQEFD